MTEEKLKKCIEINSLLMNEVHTLSNREQVELGSIGACLLSLMDKDKTFKESFNQLIKITKERLQKEFDEL